MVVIAELSPRSSSSSSVHNHTYKYDVFLSFRGADTRNNFTDHLYNALLDAGIVTFLDDEEIETGEPLKPELESAIKSSRASVIVLSKNYASSTWCLDELVLILEQYKSFKQIVIPIFYDVEPSDVRKQQNSFEEAMAQHKKRMHTESDAEKMNEWGQKMESWKMTLTQVADLKGKDEKDKKETDFIKEVVTNIHNRLGVLLSNTLPRLIGMDHYIESISSWLTDGSLHSADILTIVGMGGIGKTSLVKYVFQLHSTKFHKSSFIDAINTKCEMYNGMLDLQKQLHGDISKRTELQVNDVSVYTSKIENVLARKMVLLVLDDIGSFDQLDALLGNRGLHPGSKIIITTKDASLTKRCTLFNPQAQPKHRQVLLSGLCESESLELLCIHAFKSQNPKEGYEDVSKELVKYCQGHPLALEVLGRSLHKQEIADWVGCIKVLKKEPYSRVNNALKMSYESLPFKNDKELFKHIACLFVGLDRGMTETIMNACDINTRSGVTHLIDRCLLHIGWNNEFMMHPLVLEMGRDLVRQESPNRPQERSRLWCHEESFKVLKQKKGTKNLLGIALDMRMLNKKKLHGSSELKTESLCNMDNLMLLQLNYVQLNDCFQKFPEELRWLCMKGFPLKSVHLDLPMDNLVILDMSYSNIESFGVSYSNPQPLAKRQKVTESWSKDKRLFGSLKILDLSFCKLLHSLGGFFEFPVLEKLIVRSCISLIEVCESVEECVGLILIDMSYCHKLKRLPISLGKLKKVETLLLDGCKRWDMSSYISINSQKLSSSIPSDLKFFTTSLPSSLIILSLANNNLCNKSFPKDWNCLSMLEELRLDSNPIISMPNCVRTIHRLQKLYMDDCEMLTSIERPPPTLRVLSVRLTFKCDYKSSLRKIKFDQEMSPLRLLGTTLLPHSSIEIDGVIKIQALADVEEKLLHTLGWNNLEFIKERLFETCIINLEPSGCKTQMYYEFGIFSTLYVGKEIPHWISCRSQGPSMSFTIPSSSENLRGLNVYCCVETTSNYSFMLPMIQISNITTNNTWIYRHIIKHVSFSGNGYLSWLSHWMFGPNEMKVDDYIAIYVGESYRWQVIKECGISLVYEEEGTNVEEEEDVLGFYKSWNHIIGGDLSGFQRITGEYILNNMQLMHSHNSNIDEYSRRKEEEVMFKAFSQKKCGGPSHVVINEVE